MSTDLIVLRIVESPAWFAANPGYLLLDKQQIYNASTGQYKIGDGTTQLSALTFYGGVPYVYPFADVEETFTIIGNTQELSYEPVTNYGHYLEGQRAGIGGKIVSIVGNLITFNDDYTGYRLDSVYKRAI